MSQTMFQATRRRLALWYAAVTAVLLVVFASSIYFYVRGTLIDRVDDTLKHVVEVVDGSLLVQSTPAGDRVSIEDSFRQHTRAAVEKDRIDMEWFSPNGELLWSSLSEPQPLPLHPNLHIETVRSSAESFLRQITEPIQRNGTLLGYLRVSHPWFEVTKPIRQFSVDLAIGISAIALCVAAIGWLLSGLAISPLRQSYHSLKQFTADASHELRNPIATIQTNVQMALAYPDAEPQHQYSRLQAIERLTQRLGHLVDDLLFLARSDSGMMVVESQPVPLDALLIEVIEEQQPVAQNREVALSLRITTPDNAPCEAEDLFVLKGDWEQLARLFTNLIDNAIAHTAPVDRQGSVEVILEAIARPQPWQLRVQVKDNGSGIPQEALPHIWDRFFRAAPYSQNRATTTGAGLGLAIAKAIAQNHRGTISASSSESGTTFTVAFPSAK